MAKKETDFEVTEGDVFSALGEENANELVAKSELLSEIGDLIEKSGLSQTEVAKKLEITQSKVSLLVNGHLSEFSTDALLHYLTILGCDIKIHIESPRSRVGIFRNKGCLAVC